MRGVRRAVAAALALAPWACALYLPPFLLGQSLEQKVDAALPVAVGAIAALSLVLNVALVHGDPHGNPLTLLARGTVGLLVGTVLFHAMIILFGAPFQLLVQRTALLAVLAASSTTLPLAMHGGLTWQDWAGIVLDARARDDVEVHIASVTIAATLGAYFGAVPIPLDWDRPWQQWPLTCVYGVLGGTTVGHLVGVGVSEWIKKSKTE